MAIETFFKNIADAIRTKGGTLATLTPSQMPQAIADLPSGGGGSIADVAMEPLHFDVNNGYMSGGNFFYEPNGGCYVDVYEVQTNHRYIALIGGTIGDRFRGMYCNTDPALATGIIGGVIFNDIYNPLVKPYTVLAQYNSYSDRNNFYASLNSDGYSYIAIQKNSSNNIISGIKSYLFDVTDL